MKKKKIIGASLAGVMAVSAAASAVGAVQDTKVTEASVNKLVHDVHAKIEHITYSLKKNYLGLKNVGQWQSYIKEAKALNAKLPKGSSRDKYQARIDRAEALVNAAARVNKVEQSMEVNAHTIKNVPQWSQYINLAKEDLGKVDLGVFKAQYNELLERVAQRSEAMEVIKTNYTNSYKKVEALVEEANKLLGSNKEAAKKKLEEAKKLAEQLQSHTSKDELINKIDGIITSIPSEPVPPTPGGGGGGSVEKNLTINSSNDANGISGAYDNITISVPESETVTLSNVQVKNLKVNSGSKLNFVGTTAASMVVADGDNSIDVGMDATSSIKSLTLNSAANILGNITRSARTGVAITTVNVITNDNVKIQVPVGDVSISGAATVVLGGNAASLNIKGKDAIVEVAKDVVVNKVNVESVAKDVVITGEGTIKEAVVKAVGTVINVTNKPDNIENIVTDQSQINVKVGLTSVVDMKMPIGTSNIIEAIKTELQKHVAEGVTIKVEAVEGSKDTYSVTMTSGEYSQSKNMIGVILKADSYITKGAEIANNKASFTWGSQNGIGTKDQLDNTSGSSYKYFSDGAYITLQVLDNNKKIVKMSDVFEKITLKTGDDGKVDTIPHSNREKGDFGFDEFESYKTVLAQAAGDNSVFYGLRQSKGVAHTVGFNPGEVRKINLSVSPKKGIQVGEYTVRVNVAQQGESGVFTSIGKPIEYKFVVDNISATIEEGDLSLNQKENSIDKLTSKIKVAAKYEDISKAKITGVTYTSSNSIVVDSKTDALELIAKNPGTSTITVNSVMIDKDGNLSTTNDVEKVNIEGNNIVNLDCRDMGIVSHTFKEKIGSTEPGFGTVDWKESPFKHTTDGAFFTIELINPDNKRVLFDSGFNKFSLQTVGSVNVQEYTEGLRKQTDFGRDVSHTGTKFLSTGGIKETSLKGIMFYGIHSDIYGVNVEAGQELAIQVKGDAKIDLTGYSIKIKAYSKVRPTKDTKYTEEEFNKLTPIAEKIINL